jgi:cyclopropane fatty-acyl-phospholipid synthase-like methyltransferase
MNAQTLSRIELESAGFSLKGTGVHYGRARLPGRRSYLFSHMGAEKGAEYDRLYQTDPWHIYAWQQEQATLLRILATYYRNQHIKLLDFACGTARITSFLEDKVDEAVGVDVSESMLAVAERKVKRAKLLHANLLKDNLLAGEKFNLITAFRFFPNAEPALRNAALEVLTSLLSENGCLVLNNHINRQSMFHLYYRLKNSIARRTHRPTFSMGDCREMLFRWKLKITRVYSVGLLHIPHYQLPQALLRADDLGICSSWLAACSESPTIVCRHRR